MTLLPKKFVNYLKNTVLDESATVLSVSNTTIGKTCFTPPCKNNQRIRALFQQSIISMPNSIYYWRNFVPNELWKKSWLLYQKLIINNKMKDVSYKLIHRIYPTNQYMVKYNKTINPSCSFCKEQPETISHLFWKCSVIKIFWRDCLKFISHNIDADFLLTFELIIFGFHKKNMVEGKKLAINLIIIFSKFHIHKCKFLSSSLFFPVVLNDVELYLSSLSKSLNQKAIKTYELLSSLNVFNIT